VPQIPVTPPIAKATATVWKGGRVPVNAVSGASSDHIRIAEMPINVARPVAGFAITPVLASTVDEAVDEGLIVDF
jgi:hypothetical protein